MVQEGAAAWSEARNVSRICAAFNRAGKLCSPADQHATGPDPQQAALLHHTLATLAAAYLPLVPRLPVAKLCVVPLWACAKAGYWHGGLAAALLQRLAQDDGAVLRKANDQDHANLWWSLSAAPEHVVTAAQTDEVLLASADCLLRMGAADIGPQACSNILLAAARLAYAHPKLLLHLAAVAGQAAGRFNEQDLANSLWALAELGWRRSWDPGFAPPLQLAAECKAQRFAGFKPQELSNSVWALAKMGYEGDQEWFAAAAAAAGRPGAMAGATAQNWCNLWYGLALVRHRPGDAFLDSSVEAFGELHARAEGRECASLLWSLATLGVPYNPPLVGALLERLAGLLPQAGAVCGQELANSLWALAVMGPAALSRHRRPVEALLRGLVRRWDDAGPAMIRNGSAGKPPAREELAWLTQLWQVQQELMELEGGRTKLSSIIAGAQCAGPQGCLLGALTRAAAAWRLAADPPTSDLQQLVLSALGRLQQRLAREQLQQPGSGPPIVSVSGEEQVEGMVGRVDVVVELAGGRRVAVEVDGPWHFLANEPYKHVRAGPTQLRDRQLRRAFGAANVMSVSYLDLRALRGEAWREERYLQRLLDLPGGDGARGAGVESAGGR
ncbi:hypothetical protein TSOC_010352 [Tetrabaena socialis]|uniref:RAP domain-containing protein n=1 Tax=Tetrabaena socialis TaxID=47790 RepID=A0A2J7ZTH9_9CHLO|nr:hypothetical protein TSOC_010352 [Tetrabaena socialis]|eukprot:PNH03574.1 hypothetical protein TSOC_010352 [Tetrabaena socialis]